MNKIYSSIFNKKVGDYMNIYINEKGNISFINRNYNIIYPDLLILTEIRESYTENGPCGKLFYKIAIFKNTLDFNKTVEFIQFEDGIGCIIEIYKDEIIGNDCLSLACPLNYIIFEKKDNDNYYYDKIIRDVIIGERYLDCNITLYSDLYNIDCENTEDFKKKFENVKKNEWSCIV